MTISIHNADAKRIYVDGIAKKHSIDCIVTSPPYWGLRDYGHEDQLGNEKTPEEYIDNLFKIFDQLWHVLKPTGTCWVNLGDTYKKGRLQGIPWRVALAMMAGVKQKRQWVLRNDIIWSKPNPMPESVRNRCTKAHEYLFFFTKRPSGYLFNKLEEPAVYAGVPRGGSKNRYEQNKAGMDNKVYDTRNKRDVWTVKPDVYKDAHFATFPEELIEPCILAGCPDGGTVLDPFAGSGTTGQVAEKNGRNSTLVELKPEYIKLIRERCRTPE